MIDEQEYKSLLDSGLILDHYFLLCNMKNNIKPVDSKRIQGFINLLTKKGYIEDDKITEKGLKLIKTCSADTKVDFSTWAADVHKKMQDKLVELTGKKQVISRIRNSEFYFLDGVKVITLKLSQAISAYKLHDFDKIERALLRYIEKCHKTDNWFPLVKYFILKDRISDLATAVENEDASEEESPKTTSTQKFL